MNTFHADVPRAKQSVCAVAPQTRHSATDGEKMATIRDKERGRSKKRGQKKKQSFILATSYRARNVVGLVALNPLELGALAGMLNRHHTI